MKQINEPDSMRMASAKIALQYAMELLDCNNYEELRNMCKSLVEMADYVEMSMSCCETV